MARARVRARGGPHLVRCAVAAIALLATDCTRLAPGGPSDAAISQTADAGAAGAGSLDSGGTEAMGGLGGVVTDGAAGESAGGAAGMATGGMMASDASAPDAMPDTGSLPNACIPSACPRPDNPCEMAACVDNTCTAARHPADALCPTGACDDAGRCKCRNSDDCPGPLNVCLASGECADNACGDGVTAGSEECDDGNRITTDACADCLVAECGDGYVRSGVEECDPNASGWTRLTCNDETCGVEAYKRCMSNTNCNGGYLCFLGGCAPYADMPCPTIPGWPMAGSGFNSGCQLRCADGACPFDMICDDFGTGPTCSMEDI